MHGTNGRQGRGRGQLTTLFRVVPILVILFASSQYVSADGMVIAYPYPNTTLYIGESFQLTIGFKDGFPWSSGCESQWSVYIQLGDFTWQAYNLNQPGGSQPLTQTITTTPLAGILQSHHGEGIIYATCDWEPPGGGWNFGHQSQMSMYIHEARKVYAEFTMESTCWYGTDITLKWASYGPSTEWGIWYSPDNTGVWTEICTTTDLSCSWNAQPPDNNIYTGVTLQIRDARDNNIVINTGYIKFLYPSIDLVRPFPAVIAPNTTFIVTWTTDGPIVNLTSLTYHLNQDGKEQAIDPSTPTPPNTGSYKWQVPATITTNDSVTITACIQYAITNPLTQCDYENLIVIPPPPTQSIESS